MGESVGDSFSFKTCLKVWSLSLSAQSAQSTQSVTHVLKLLTQSALCPLSPLSPLSPVAHSPASGAYLLLGLEGIVILIIISFNFHLQRGEVFCSQSSLSEIVVITGELSALTDHTRSCRV